MAKGKDKKATEAQDTILEETQVKDVPITVPDVKHIRITLEGYMNITPTFSISDLTVQANHVGKHLGVSTKTLIIDDDYIPTHHEFVMECDISSARDLDQLISNPIIFTVVENVGTVDSELLAKLGSQPKPPEQEVLILSADSAADLAEAFTGKAVDRRTFIASDTSEEVASKKGSKKDMKKSKSDMSKKDKKDSKTSNADKTGKVKEKSSELTFLSEPVAMGTATLDLLPLFQGHMQISESLLVHQPQKVYDDRIVPTNIMPRLVVQVTIDEETWLPDDPKANVFSLSVESIYNIPNVMSQEMQYSVSTWLPLVFAKWEYVVVSGGKFKDTTDMEKIKKWPGMLEENSLSGATKYRIDECRTAIKNDIEVNLEVLNSEKPRIEWNVIKRNFLKEDAIRQFSIRLKKYRHLPLEVYVTTAQNTSSLVEGSLQKASEGRVRSKSDASSKSEKGKKSGKIEKGGGGGKKEVEDYLHLMTAVDVSTLLYPGVQKCRVACPLSTYQQVEFQEQTGQDNSCFVPRVDEIPQGLSKTDDKKKVSGKKSDMGSTTKSKGSKSDKESKKGGKATIKDGNKNDLKPLLPSPPPPPPQPSTPVYNENGERTFIVIEIEFLKPLTPKRDIEDLSNQLLELLPEKPSMNKIVVSSRLADLYFKDVIRQLTEDLIHQHEHYLKEKEGCNCQRQESGDSQVAFLTYLQRSGVYHTYQTSITKAASVVVNDEFPNNNEFNRSSKEYQNFIAEVYSFLIKEMNGVLNELTTSGAETTTHSSLVELDALLLYAKEASAIGAKLLADRYHLERICRNQANGNCWFDYAVFQLEIGDRDKAFECAKQCLEVNNKHHYSLLLCGILLSEKMLYEEAETCFLMALLENQEWVEGWGSMHLFYSKIGNREGADLCLEMANKYLSTAGETDYFSTIDDLAWTTTICPNTVFFRTAMFLLKIRAFTYAEKSLVHELIKQPGISHYYLAVIMYFYHNYTHALVHLREAERLHGSDYAVASLMGHCFLALRKLQSAKEQYLRVLESYNRPDDLHLLYMHMAIVWDRLGDKQSARKLLLVACKYSPTPYIWLTVGILYYGQRDLLSAEQCLTQANLCDNRLPEIWGYLTVVNLELHRYNEAELCYRQTKKNEMRDKELEKRIENAMMSLTKNEEHGITN